MAVLPSRLFLDLIEFSLELSDSLELRLEFAAHLLQACAIFLKYLTSLVQQVDHVIELISRHVKPAGFGNPRKRTMRASLRYHQKGYERPKLSYC